MKPLKTAFVIIMCIAIMLSSAYAEEFSLRSGIQFGDTIETIVQKEKTLTRNGIRQKWMQRKVKEKK